MDKSQVRSCLSATGSITYDPLTGIIGGGGGGVTPAALTKVDDTNVTLTLGGTPSTALLQATSITVGWSGQLSVARGGTGLGTLGTANQLLRVNAGATALEYFTPTYLTGLTVGTTPITGGTVGRVLFEGAGNVLQENAILNLDTTNGLIIGGATARGTRLTIVNSANTFATKIVTFRNAADSADVLTVRGDGTIQFNNIAGLNLTTNIISVDNISVANVFSTAAANMNIAIGLGNAWTYTAGTVSQNQQFGSNNSVISTTGTTTQNNILGYTNYVQNSSRCIVVGNFTGFLGATRTIVIGSRNPGPNVGTLSTTDVTIIGHGLTTGGLSYTNSLTTYFNSANASHWLQGNGNIGLFGKLYDIQNDNVGSVAVRLTTYMNLTATNTLTIHNGTETNGNITNAIQVYAKDITAGNSALHVWDEAGRIFYAGANVGMRSNHDLQLAANNTVYAVLSTAGRMYVGGSTTPTAKVHIAAGSATANTAPVKFTSGTILGTPEAGTMEYNGRFYLTDTDAAQRHIVQAATDTKTTAGAPYTNDGYVEVYINGTLTKLMTTA